jgi:nucleotide-binding universal stress UspA family protein
MSKNLNTIVIGTSLTSESDAIVRTGAAIARAANAAPWLLHAYALPAFPPELGSADAQWTDEETEKLRARMLQQAERAGIVDLKDFAPEQAILVLGSPYREIVKLARRLEADLIVVGASEGRTIQKALLGSTADRVVRKTPCPVLVVRSATKFPPLRVVIPVDLSPVSALALRYGLMFLRDAAGRTVEREALFVLNPLEVAGSLQFTPGQIERFADHELRRFVDENAPVPGVVAHRVLAGYPREEILAVLADGQADLAILGTHGRSGFERLMIGSVAAEVLERAGCNVLIVPPTSTVHLEGPSDADWAFEANESRVSAGRP